MKSHATEPHDTSSLPEVIAATSAPEPEQAQILVRARAFAEPLLLGESLPTGENTLTHADAVAEILKTIGGSQAMQASSYLVYACQHLTKPLAGVHQIAGCLHRFRAANGFQNRRDGISMHQCVFADA